MPKAALVAGTETSIYHRTDEFYRIFLRATELLQPVFGSRNRPIILTSSGSGAMEAAVTNLTAAGDEVVAVDGGKFGERWRKLAQAYGCKTEVVPVEWGHAPTAEQILAAIKRQAKTKAVFFQANETSTGVYYPVEELVRAIRKEYDGLVVVDCISSLGAHAMKMDEWQIDCVVAGSQKGFGIPAGLAFIALSDKAWGQISNRPRFYFDLQKERKGQAEGRSAYTPANSLIMSLVAALEVMHQTGLDVMLAHHQHLAEAARAAVQGMGLKLFPTGPCSNALTAVTLPPSVDGSKLGKRLRQRFGTFFAGGQDQLKGKIMRIAHLGFVSRFDLIDALAAFEFGLAEEGHAFDLGSGVKAAMQSLAKAP